LGDKVPAQYIRVKEDILLNIKKGNLDAGDQLETEQQLAKRYGVSRPTVRQSLMVLESEGYVERIQGRGTYVAVPETPEAAPVASKTIGVVVPRLVDVFIGKLITGAQEILTEHGHHVSVHITNDSPENEAIFIKDLLERDVAGLIIHPTNSDFYNSIMYSLNDGSVPFVMTGRHYRYLNCNFVEADNYGGAYHAVEHLVELGHRNIGLITKPVMIKSSLEDRINGYCDALADHDIPIHRKLMLTQLSDKRSAYWDGRSEQEIDQVFGELRKHIENSPEMTAVIALNDLIAADIIQVIEELGKVPGRDISVIGFDNVNQSERLMPPLTTVEFSIIDIGREAARILLDHIENPNTPPEGLHVPTRLVARESCSQCL
jgi:GntR family transcriptional regulator, arabinose operon transcriptional repressor